MGLGGSKHPLHEACSNGNLTTVVELLADGEDCNRKDEASDLAHISTES